MDIQCRQEGVAEESMKKIIEKLGKSVADEDREALQRFASDQGTIPIELVPLRRSVKVSGQVVSVRIVPRAGSDALEATVSDGRSSVVGVFLGRRQMGGMSAGRKLILEGVIYEEQSRRIMLNPIYTLLP